MMRTRKKLLVQSFPILFHEVILTLMLCLSYFFKLLGDYLNFEHLKHVFLLDVTFLSFHSAWYHIPQL